MGFLEFVATPIVRRNCEGQQGIGAKLGTTSGNHCWGRIEVTDDY
ncbi:Uncharacterised protein [Yersinia rohdei]|nr:Uncharacterised protein [Yersinia rohdei]CQJ49089.1 Uncharacterised protein [Yersinia rohdei]